MKKDKLKTYRIEIVEKKTEIIVSVMGKGYTRKQADERILTGLMRSDADKYFIRKVEESN